MWEERNGEGREGKREKGREVCVGRKKKEEVRWVGRELKKGGAVGEKSKKGEVRWVAKRAKKGRCGGWERKNKVRGGVRGKRAKRREGCREWLGRKQKGKGGGWEESKKGKELKKGGAAGEKRERKGEGEGEVRKGEGCVGKEKR